MARKYLYPRGTSESVKAYWDEIEGFTFRAYRTAFDELKHKHNPNYVWASLLLLISLTMEAKRLGIKRIINETQ